MKTKSQTSLILAYVSAHPECTFGEVLRHTELPRSCVNSALWRLAAHGQLLRSGVSGEFRYSVPKGTETNGWKAQQHSTGFTPKFGCSNPLTAMFNQCLAGVRG